MCLWPRSNRPTIHRHRRQQHHNLERPEFFSFIFLTSFRCFVCFVLLIFSFSCPGIKDTKDFNEYNRNSHHENKREKHHKWLFTTENLVDGLFSSPEFSVFFFAELYVGHFNLSDHTESTDRKKK